jgi:hypothetical protein
MGCQVRNHVGDVRLQVDARVQQMRALGEARQGEGNNPVAAS